MTQRLAFSFVALLLVFAFGTGAQPPGGIKRSVLQRTEIPGGDREIVLGLAEIAPGVAAGRHAHSGVETGYMIEGEAVMEVEGESPRTLKAGDSYLIPAGKVHDARAIGERPVKVLATYVVEKGKPFSAPH